MSMGSVCTVNCAGRRHVRSRTNPAAATNRPREFLRQSRYCHSVALARWKAHRLAIERAAKLLNNETSLSVEREQLREVVKQMAPPLRQIVARRKDRFVLLSLERILYFRIESGLLRARTVTESYWADYYINDLESRLPSPPFSVFIVAPSSTWITSGRSFPFQEAPTCCD